MAGDRDSDKPRSSRISQPSSGEYLAVGGRSMLKSWPFLVVALLFGGGGLGVSSLSTRPNLVQIQSSVTEIKTAQRELKISVDGFVKTLMISEERGLYREKRLSKAEAKIDALCERISALELDKAARGPRVRR